MKQYAEHDKIGICHALRKDEIYVRTFSGGYPYLNGDILLRSSSIKPIYSYGKNYEKGDRKFALFVWTTNSNQSEVESLLESAAKDVTDEQIDQTAGNGSFIYLA